MACIRLIFEIAGPVVLISNNYGGKDYQASVMPIFDLSKGEKHGRAQLGITPNDTWEQWLDALYVGNVHPLSQYVRVFEELSPNSHAHASGF